MKEIPNECIYRILINIAEDSKSLFSCCLINCLWCLNTIPILWSNPLQRNVSKSLVQTYLSTLSPEEKKPLISFGLAVSDLPKPLFDYGTFLKVLDTSSTEKGVKMWLDDGGFIGRFYINRHLILGYYIIMDTLVTMFLRRSKNLEELLINGLIFPAATAFLIDMSEMIQLKTLRFRFQQNKNYINTNIMALMNRLMYTLTPKVCSHLEQLSILSYLSSDTSDALIDIIKAQKRLETLELNTYYTTRVVVYNISNNASEETVKNYFSICGSISEFMLTKNKKDGKQIAYITFDWGIYDNGNDYT